MALNSSDNSFCDDPLWDVDKIWNTDSPDFTTCFHQTVLLYVPAGLLYLFSPLSIWSCYKSKDREIPWTITNVTRITLNLLLIILPLIDLGYAIDEG